MYTGFATQLWSCGGADFVGRSLRDRRVRSRCGRPTDFVAALHAAGPTDWPEQRWYELALDFAHGRYGLMVDSDHYVAYFEEPATSSSSSARSRYALPPLGPTGERRPNLWTWSVVMNTRARDRDEAWRFVEWATGREFLLRSAFEGNMNPTRASIWDDDAFRAHTSGWGDVPRRRADADRARRVGARHARVELPRDRRALGRGAARRLRGRAEAAEALGRAADAIDPLVGG